MSGVSSVGQCHEEGATSSEGLKDLQPRIMSGSSKPKSGSGLKKLSLEDKVKSTSKPSGMREAKRAVSGNESWLQCTVCVGTLQDPVLLPCLHSLCGGCVQPGLDACPVCHTKIDSQHIIKNHFLSSLAQVEAYQSPAPKLCAYCSYEDQQTSADSHCIQCGDALCSTCTQAHRRTKMTRNHTILALVDLASGQHHGDLRANQGVACPAHPGQSYTHMCLQCDALICCECKMADHDKHQWTSLEQASLGLVKKAQPVVESVAGRMSAMKEHLGLLNTYEEQVYSNKDKVAGAIEKQAQHLHQMVEQYRAHMMEAVLTSTNAEAKMVQEKRQNTQHMLDKLTHTHAFVKFLFQQGKPVEIMLARHSVTDRLNNQAYVTVDALTKKLNMHFTSGTCSPQQVHNVFGKLDICNMPVGSPHISVSLTPPTTKLSLTASTPSVKLLYSFECSGPSDSKDIWPTGVAMDQAGQVLVVDRENKSVKVFDVTGKLRSEFGRKILGCPYDVTVLPNHHIAVTDHGDEDIKVFLPTGDLVSVVKGKLRYPRGITHNRQGQIVVVDAHYRRVKVIEPIEGHELKVNQGQLEDEGTLNDPYYVTTNDSNNIIVSDWGSPHVKIYSPEGAYLSCCSSAGASHNQLLQPYGICTDTCGNIVVADNQNHRLQLLSPTGRFMGFLVGKEHGLWHPMAVTITQNGHLVVTEALGKVKVFKFM